MKRPVYFIGRNSFLSNFYVCSILAWGRSFTTVEAEYMYRKCVFYEDMETAEKVVATRTGLQAKTIARPSEIRRIYAHNGTKRKDRLCIT